MRSFCIAHFALFFAVLGIFGGKQLQELQLLGVDAAAERVYPKRSMDEAAVLEWGSSAIISAIDVSIAHFGPQTHDAALLEVEATPVLAKPINGMSKSIRSKETDGGKEETGELEPLENSGHMEGNLCIMTNENDLTGVEMAMIAQKSGAVALLVVNLSEERPDDIFRLPQDPGHEAIHIPVGMISLNSANVLMTANTDDMAESQGGKSYESGLPERVRLYAGEDRPFFEDVEAQHPTIYLIHNLLSDKECEAMIHQAKGKVDPVVKSSDLEYVSDPTALHGVKRTVLWQGAVPMPGRKEIEDRIEQVTGFPSQQFSDFVVDELMEGSYWDSHYRIFPSLVPVASMLVFLSEPEEGGDVVYLNESGDKIRIRPRKGTAVLHHTTDELGEFDQYAKHSLLPVKGAGASMYIASKYFFHAPLSNVRRNVLPIVALPFQGKLPSPIIALYGLLVDRFGVESGGEYFDKACIFIPVLVGLLLLQIIIYLVAGRRGRKGEEKKKVS